MLLCTQNIFLLFTAKKKKKVKILIRLQAVQHDQQKERIWQFFSISVRCCGLHVGSQA